MRQLRKLGDLSGYGLRARDGDIGKLKQVYFDDRHWVVRYFVVQTGSWLLGRQVLIIPAAVTGVDEDEGQLDVSLTREQIRHSPPVESELPVSRHYEYEYYRYFGWEPYWNDDPVPGSPPSPAATTQAEAGPENPYLRSSAEVTGYSLRAPDGDIGQVEDFILEEPGWAIPYLEVDTRNWLPGKHVLLAPAWIEAIDWANQDVAVALTRDAIRTAPAYDPSRVIGRDYEVELYKHYGKMFEKD